MKKLKDRELLTRDGGSRYGHWKLHMEDANCKTDTTSGKHQESIGKTSGKDRKSAHKELNHSQREIITIISLDGQITIPELAKKIGISSRNVEENIRVLKEEGILIRRVGRKEGYWEIDE